MVTGGESNDPKLLTKLLPIVVIDITLGDCAAIFSMYHMHVTKETFVELSQLFHDYFTVVVSFSSAHVQVSVSVTVWSTEHLVYSHSKKMFDKFGI